MYKWLQDYQNLLSELKPTTYNHHILGILKEIQHNLGAPKNYARVQITPNYWEFMFPQSPKEF